VTVCSESRDVWWDTHSRALKLRPHVFEGRAGKRFERWWEIFVETKLTEIAFMYEMDARLDRVSAIPTHYQWRKAAPRYAYGKPFHLLNDHGYGALQEACGHWMHEHPKKGHELLDEAPALFLPDDWPAPRVGRGPWTELIADATNTHGHPIRLFAINLSQSDATIRKEARRRTEELNLGHRGIAHFMGLVKVFRAKYGVPPPPANPVTDEARNFRPWNHTSALVDAARHWDFRNRRITPYTAEKMGQLEYAFAMPGSLRKRVADAEEAYAFWTAKFPLRLIHGRMLNPWFSALSNSAVHDAVMRDA
jgi:hypothetical protein